MNTRQLEPHRWPTVPRTPEAWMALDELGFGRHLVADIGWVSSQRQRAVAAGVTDLPAPLQNVDDGVVRLPAVTVVGVDGSMRMFRLPVSYLVAIRRLFAEERARKGLTNALETQLPCHFLIGDRETVWLFPDGESGGQHLN